MTEDELLAAIQAEPDSDAPRLVYADWLQSQGDPLGEYIALSLRQTEDPAVRARLAELPCEREWDRHFGGIEYRTVEHGMIASLGLGVPQLEPVLLEQLRGMFIRNLSLGSSGVELEDRHLAVLRDALARMHLRRLSFQSEISPDRLAELLEYVPHVERLSFWTIIDDDAARVIAEASLPKLACLGVEGWRLPDGDRSWIGDRGARVLAARGGLVELALTHVAIGPDGAAALVSGRLPLTSLDLSGNKLGAPGVEAITGGVAPLESLTLADVGLDDEAVAAIANAPMLGRLRRLAFATTRTTSGLTKAQLDMLIASPYLSRELVLALDGVALEMEVWSSPGSVYCDPIDPMWSGSPPAALEARFRVEVVGEPPE